MRIDYSWIALTLPFIEQNNVYDALDFKKSWLDPANAATAGTIIDSLLCPSTAQRDAQRNGFDIIPDWEASGVSLGCTDYMGIAGPSSSKFNSTTGTTYDRQQGILVGTKGLEGSETMLVPPPVTMALVTDGTSSTMMVVECTGRGTEKSDDDPNGAWISGKNITHIQGTVNGESAKDSWNNELIYSEHSGGANVLYVDGSVHFLNDEATESIIVGLASRSGGELVNP